LGVFWLKMNEIHFMEEEIHIHPILLLDDVFSEFDHENKERIIRLIETYQTVMTTTEVELVKEYKKKNTESVILRYKSISSARLQQLTYNKDMRILVVEDEHRIAHSLQKVLSKNDLQWILLIRGWKGMISPHQKTMILLFLILCFLEWMGSLYLRNCVKIKYTLPFFSLPQRVKQLKR